MLEASLRVMSRYCPKLEAEAQDLKNNCKLHPRQVTSQVCMKLNVLTVNMQDKVFQDTHFHGQLSSVILLQVTYYNFLIIFIMHSFLKLRLSSCHLHYIVFFLYYLPLGKLGIVPHYTQKLRAFFFFETILFKVITVLP